jgi:hypothetical protein
VAFDGTVYAALGAVPTNTDPPNATYWQVVLILIEQVPQAVYEAIMAYVPVVFDEGQTTNRKDEAEKQYKKASDHSMQLLRNYLRLKGFSFRAFSINSSAPLYTGPAPVEPVTGLTLPTSAPAGTVTKHVVAIDGDNAQILKGSPGTVYSWDGFNDDGSVLFIKLYDKATITNVGVDSPVKIIAMQAGTPTNFAPPGGLAFEEGIGLAIVKGIADTDDTPVTANSCYIDISLL